MTIVMREMGIKKGSGDLPDSRSLFLRDGTLVVVLGFLSLRGRDWCRGFTDVIRSLDHGRSGKRSNSTEGQLRQLAGRSECPKSLDSPTST